MILPTLERMVWRVRHGDYFPIGKFRPCQVRPSCPHWRPRIRLFIKLVDQSTEYRIVLGLEGANMSETEGPP
jgi:hypothetical protein